MSVLLYISNGTRWSSALTVFISVLLFPLHSEVFKKHWISKSVIRVSKYRVFVMNQKHYNSFLLNAYAHIAWWKGFLHASRVSATPARRDNLGPGENTLEFSKFPSSQILPHSAAAHNARESKSSRGRDVKGSGSSELRLAEFQLQRYNLSSPARLRPHAPSPNGEYTGEERERMRCCKFRNSVDPETQRASLSSRSHKFLSRV